MNAVVNKRLSNIELLRMLAMFLVLVVHADFFSLGRPTCQEVQEAPLAGFMRILTESVSIVSVNVFVLVSGWFGIRPKLRSFGNFVVQCLFILTGIYVVCLMAGTATLCAKGVLDCLALTPHYWFIKAYVCLYILAPVLNAFVQTATRRQMATVLLSFYAFQTLYACLFNATDFFVKGYSPVSFVGLYLLARYVRIYPHRIFRLDKCCDMAIFLAIAVLESVVVWVPSWLGLQFAANAVMDRIYPYTSPLVVAASLYLLLFFSKLHFRSRWVNRLSASCFVVYLLHLNPNLCEPYFKGTIVRLHDTCATLPFVGLTLLFLLAVYALALFIDQPRLFLWKKFCGWIDNR